MARRLQSPERSRAPIEDSPLPQVASDPVIQRSVRPEPASGRAAAPGGARSGSFETLLDTPARAPAARPERASRTRSSDRSDRARPAGHDNGARTQTRSSGDSIDAPKASAKDTTKPAETAQTAQDKNSQ